MKYMKEMTSRNNIDINKPRRPSYQYERVDIQKKSFAKWMNYVLRKGRVKIYVKDVIDDLQDGTVLLALVEVLTGRHLSQERGNMRVHHINNINKVLKVLQVYDTKLVNIRSEEVVDGKENIILGLIWSLILNFQIKAAINQMTSSSSDFNNNELERNLLKWCNDITHKYRNLEVKNFTTSWRDGLAFNAILHNYRGDLFDYHELIGQSANSNLRHAFNFANSNFRIAPLLDPEDVNTDKPDKKSIMMYVTTMYEVLTSLKETNAESEGSEQEQMGARSDSPTPSSVSTMSEWDDYNDTLSQVLTWLLQAETQLNQQEDVSQNVDKVKDQFREHEEFMMILTSHQASVGSVLEFGSQLINEGIVTGREERDIREQMALLSDRWENLRVSAMQRQSDLHQHLMKLQQSQLKDLSDWLSNAEKTMSTTPQIASDIETVRKQVEEHKRFQEDLENQQQHVNSLSHMVVVVDDSESENATADLEEQLAVLGDRWSAVCKWTESRWVTLQEILSNWQQYRSEEQRLDNWLRQEEDSLRAISVIDMGNKDEVQKQLEKLKNLEHELTEQQSSFGEFNLAAQRVAQSLEEDSPAIQGILDTMEDFNRRWNTIASMLNTKMKHFCGMENKLQSFLKEIEENMSWISDTETLLNPQASPQRDLIESLDQAIKKRRTSIAALSRQGEELIKQTLSAGQSIAGIKQYLSNFREKWDALIETMNQRKQTLEMMEKKKALTDESQRILIVVVEIITYIEKITLELKHDPKELLVKIELKIKELDSCRVSFEKLSTEIVKEISDQSLKKSLEAELKTLQEKLQVAGKLLADKQKSTSMLVESTPPPEFLDKMTAVRKAIDAIFPSVNCEFKYNTVTSMQASLEALKVKSNDLNDQETLLKFLSKQQKEMLKDLSLDSYKKYQEELSELSKHWLTTRKMTESRLQRLREAILQTNELETALKETFSWMNDVDKFLEEITGTVAEGDAETIESQVLEVEALQQDIDLVQKKVDSLIETCTQIIKRAEQEYGKTLGDRLNELHRRWAAIKTSTEKQKENLRNAGLKFKEVDSGIRDILQYLSEVESMCDPSKLEDLDKAGLINKTEYFQEVKTQLSVKADIIKQFQETVNQIMANIPAGGVPPPVFQDLEKADEKFQHLTVAIKELQEKILLFNSELEKYDAHVNDVKLSMDKIDETIGSSSQKLDVDDEELQSCFNLLKNLVLKINNEELKEIQTLTASLLEFKIASNIPKLSLQELNTRWDVTLERSKKVQFILEGELMRRQQLKKDLVQLRQWLLKSIEQINERLSGSVEVDDQYIDSLAEEISLNESLKISMERSVRKDSQEKLEEIQKDWMKLMTLFEQLKSFPKVKELERKFSALEGSILTDIDCLKRKTKKIILNSPVVQDIQISVENLEEISKMCVDIDEQIKDMKDLADSISNRGKAGGLVKHIHEVVEEYEKLKTIISSKEKIFANALPLAEAVFANLDMVTTWLEAIIEDFDNISVDPLPLTPEESIDKLQALLKDTSDRATDIRLLHSNALALCQLSDEKSFKALESDVLHIFNSYNDLSRNGKNKLDVLKSWARDLDEYERKVDDLNAWIDGRLSTLDSIGGVSNKFDVETELQKVKSIRSLFEAKEGELKILKLCADDISQKGNSKIVEPFEKQIKERWEQLDKKINDIFEMLTKKIEEIENEEKKATMKIISEEEVVIDEPIRVKELHTVPDMDVTDSKSLSLLEEVQSALPDRMNLQTKSSSQSTSKVSIKISSLSNQKKTKVEVRGKADNTKLEERCHQVDNELNRINTSLNDLKLNNNETEFEERNSIFHNIEEELSNLHGEYEELLRHFEMLDDVSNPELLNLVEKFNKTLIIFLETKIKTISELFNYHQMRQDLEDIERWVDQTENILNVSKEPQKIKAIEETFEKYSALIESVNLRAEMLLAASSEKQISKMQFSLLNKRFKIISKHFERYQSPEEKMTTYKVSVFTGNFENGDTRANVYIKLFGEYGNSDQLQLRQSETKRKKFQVNQVDLFTLREHPWLGKLSKLRIWHDNTGFSPEWFVGSVYIQDELSGKIYAFSVNTWINKDSSAVVKEFPFTAMTLSKETTSDILLKPHQFSNVFWVYNTLSYDHLSKKFESAQDLIDDIDLMAQEISNLTNNLCTWNQIEMPFDQFDKQIEIHQHLETTCQSLAIQLFYLLKGRSSLKSTQQNENIHRVNSKIATLLGQWNTVNHEWHAKATRFAHLKETWEVFHTKYCNLSMFLDELKALSKDDMREALSAEESNFNTVKEVGEKISQQSSKSYKQSIDDKISLIQMQWLRAEKELNSKNDTNTEMTVEMEHVMMEIMNLNDYHNTVMFTRPHPVDEDELEKFLNKLKTIQRELPAMGESINELKVDADKILRQSNISTRRQEEITSHVSDTQRKYDEITQNIDSRLHSMQAKLERATKFLEELEELSVWMSATRDLLEGQQMGKPGVSIDPETMKLTLETRKSNVESINRLLTQFKDEGELTSGRFPLDVGEKIARLNIDWQVIIRLAIALKDHQPTAAIVEEPAILMDSVHITNTAPQNEQGLTTSEDVKVNISFNDYSSTHSFESKIAQLNDFLKLIENKLKGLDLIVGDDDDMQSALQKQTNIRNELDSHRCELEETIEVGAAINMNSNDQAQSYAIDDKISKVKEHWDVVSDKVSSVKLDIENLMVDWRKFNDLRQQMENFIYKSQIYLNDTQKVGSTVTELEEQLEKHKQFEGDVCKWCETYNDLIELGDGLRHTHSHFNFMSMQTKLENIKQSWFDLQNRSHARQKSLQEALDRLLLFHKNMISALTWLSSAESKVAELDSLVDASQTDESTANIKELQKEMMDLERDISAQEPVFMSLNQAGNQIIVDLEAGEVRTALQSKLDDMNDRWNSLGVRVVDIRERMSSGTGEWRQLLLDMQEIVDWLARADQELRSHQPIGRDIVTIRRQNDDYQEFKSKLTVRHVVIEQALNQGHEFLKKHQTGGSESDANTSRAAHNLRNQLTNVEGNWQELIRCAEKWNQSLTTVLQLFDELNSLMDSLNEQLNEAENIRNRWLPVTDVPPNSMSTSLDETKNVHEKLLTLEPRFEKAQGSMKELRHIHNIALGNSFQSNLDNLHDRWKHLLSDSELRVTYLDGQVGDMDPKTSSLLPGSVSPPWERGAAANKVPYFINHDTKTTQWDHPKITELYNTLAELNSVKFAAYRTSMKLRCIQQACCLDLVDLSHLVTRVFNQFGLQSGNDELIDVGDIINILLAVFQHIEKSRKADISVAQCVDLTLNWLLNVYDSGRIGKLRILSFKVAVVLLSRAKLEDKWKYLFQQVADPTGFVDSKKLGLLLHDCVQIPRQLGEIAAFGGSNIEPSVRSCFEKSKNPGKIDVNNFLSWTHAEPQSIVWMPVLHRLAAAETAKHEAKCNICKKYPIVGFRYRCLKCFNYDLCQGCFWSGRVSKSHRITHPMHQYSLQTTTGEDMSDFVKLMKNKFKSRRYRKPSSKKLGYLPVQTIMEGSNIETPSIPMVGDMSNSFDGMDGGGNSSFEYSRFTLDDVAEEHRLIQQMCRSLNGLHTKNTTMPLSPSQILESLEIEQKQDITQLIQGLEEENMELNAEKNRLLGMKQSRFASDSQLSMESAKDAELMAEAKMLRQHKSKLETRMQVLEDHNKQLEAQLQRLRQLLEQPPAEKTPQYDSSARVTPSLTPSSSYHGSPEFSRKGFGEDRVNGFDDDRRAVDIQQVTSQIEHAFPVE